jgi:hypothetical protein
MIAIDREKLVAWLKNESLSVRQDPVWNLAITEVWKRLEMGHFDAAQPMVSEDKCACGAKLGEDHKEEYQGTHFEPGQ